MSSDSVPLSSSESMTDPLQSDSMHRIAMYYHMTAYRVKEILGIFCLNPSTGGIV